ncbi:MAG: hypothetical protein JWQ22_67 [Devosia sp.]|nr:hypothetical protein [Devosia sp.]
MLLTKTVEVLSPAAKEASPPSAVHELNIRRRRELWLDFSAWTAAVIAVGVLVVVIAT